MLKPLVSFIMPTYKREKMIQKVLNKLTPISNQVNGEIIVADNNINENTAKMIRLKFPKVRLYCAHENLGVKARNIALKMAKSLYVFMMDDDSCPLPGTIMPGIKILQKDKTIGCLAYLVDLSAGKKWSNGVYTVFTGCGALFPKKALEKIGGYPEDILYYAEEYEVTFRLYGKGYRTVSSKKLSVFHDKPPGNKDFPQRLFQLLRNNSMIYSKYLPKAWAIKHIEYENWRYKKIAEKEKAMKAYNKGLREALFMAGEYLGSNRYRLSEKVACKALGLDLFEKRFLKFAKKNKIRQTVILGVGKFLPEIINMAKSHGIEIKAVIEKNKFMKGAFIEGVEIKDITQIGGIKFDCVISGSLSLIVNDEQEKAVSSIKGFKNRPFFRACDYDF